MLLTCSAINTPLYGDKIVNSVYVNKKLGIDSSYVIINDKYPVHVIKDNYTEEIRMNSSQRKSFGIVIGDLVKITECESINEIKSCTLRISSMKFSKIINHNKISRHLKNHLKNTIIQKEVNVITQYNEDGKEITGSASVLIISPIESDIEYGVITDNTKIILKSGHNLIIEGNVSETPIKWNGKLDNVGGLNNELKEILRRAFLSRTLSDDERLDYGLEHIKGIIFYGPPGCGKTLIARELGKAINCASVTSIGGPEIKNKFYGSSEENIRNLFPPPDKAGLHLIIIDEIDAICRARSDSTNNIGDGVVNQLLVKMDGEQQQDNILVIGLTNRLDIIDPALLRPGRFEVKLKIDLPSFDDRIEIFNIHTSKMRRSNKLDLRNEEIEKIAEMTEGFSGADIAGMVRDAISRALIRGAGSKVVFEDFKIPKPEEIKNKSFISPAIVFGSKSCLEEYKGTIIRPFEIVSLSSNGKITYLVNKFMMAKHCIIIEDIDRIIEIGDNGRYFNNTVMQTLIVLINDTTIPVIANTNTIVLHELETAFKSKINFDII